MPSRKPLVKRRYTIFKWLMRPVPVVFLRRAFSLQPTVCGDGVCERHRSVMLVVLLLVQQQMMLLLQCLVQCASNKLQLVCTIATTILHYSQPHSARLHSANTQAAIAHQVASLAANHHHSCCNLPYTTYICEHELLETRKLRMCSSGCGMTSSRIDGTACASCSSSYRKSQYPCPSYPSWLCDIQE